jgi:hypothetical protein
VLKLRALFPKCYISYALLVVVYHVSQFSGVLTTFTVSLFSLCLMTFQDISTP